MEDESNRTQNVVNISENLNNPMEDESNRTQNVVNISENSETGRVSVQLPHSQEGSLNVDNSTTTNHVVTNASTDEQEDHNGADNEEINGSSAPPLMNFIELIAYVGASAGFSSVLLGFLQLSRNESHRPFHSHHLMSIMTVVVVMAIVIGMFLAAIIHSREKMRGAFVLLSYLLCILAVVACVLVGVLVCLP